MPGTTTFNLTMSIRRGSKHIGITCHELPSLHLYGEPEKVLGDVWPAIIMLRRLKNCKLSLAARLSIRKSDLPNTILAAGYGVHPKTISRIKHHQDPLLDGKGHAR